MSTENSAQHIPDLDAIKVGDFITVLGWNSQDRSFVGEPLKVLAIQLPFVAVLDLRSDYRISLNTREAKLVSISKEFVDALRTESEVAK